MAGFVPDEGETLLANLAFINADVDRGTDLDLVLITNVGPTDTITAATIVQPTGGNYAPIVLTDASWTVTGDTASYALRTFTADGSAINESITGYAILTKGTTPRALVVEIDAGGPYTMNQNDTYDITPNITVA